MIQILGWMIIALAVPILVQLLVGYDKDGTPNKLVMFLSVCAMIALGYLGWLMNEQANSINSSMAESQRKMEELQRSFPR